MKVRCIDKARGEYVLQDCNSVIQFFPGDHPSRAGKAVYWSVNGESTFYHQPIPGSENGQPVDIGGAVKRVAEKFLYFIERHSCRSKA